jgi:uncharacterized protein YbaP (TraB family)
MQPDDDHKLQHLQQMLATQQLSRQVKVTAENILVDLTIDPPRFRQDRHALVQRHLHAFAQVVACIQAGLDAERAADYLLLREVDARR